MPNRQPCAGAIVHDTAGKLLLIRRGRAPSIGSWSIPGGRCRPGEDPRDACVREVAEETGLTVEVVRFAGQVERDAPDGSIYVIDDFVCRVIGGELMAGDDASEVRWVSREDLAVLPLVPGLIEALSEWDELPRCVPAIRDAHHDDVADICAFGEAHIRAHYTPLIGAAAADDQVRQWWNESSISAAVTSRSLVVAELDGQIVGVGQRGRNGADHVIYKLYLATDQRGAGLGPRLIEALIDQLPADADRIFIEHFVGNERAGRFYEREGFAVERIEPSPTGDPVHGTVWRVRALTRPVSGD